MNDSSRTLELQVPSSENATRLDKFLALQLNDHSRSQIQQWIKDGQVSIDDEICIKPKTHVLTDDTIVVHIPNTITSTDQPENIPLDIIHEDEALLIINKPAGLVVHPGAGNPNHTLVNGLLYHHPELNTLPRAGIVHRLDKDTSGLLMVAKTQAAYLQLTHDLAQRTIKRRYQAIVDGMIPTEGTIDEPIGRNPQNRQKMAVTPTGKPAQTSWQIRRRLAHYSLIQVQLHTGRTHQIRVHMQFLGHPLLGDPTYGKHRGYQSLDKDPATKVLDFKRQALHAYQLKLTHPTTQKTMEFTSPLPQDLQTLIQTLSYD